MTQLIVVSGPSGTGKTTLAHAIATAIGCPAICRDEIKEGMARDLPGFAGSPSDELTIRTLPVFFAVVELLLGAGVTLVAEAAFQDKVWRPWLEPLHGLADIRVVACTADARVAFSRSLRRRASNPRRRVHADPGQGDEAAFIRQHLEFVHPSLGVPTLEVDTTDGYQPGIEAILAFLAG